MEYPLLPKILWVTQLTSFLISAGSFFTTSRTRVCSCLLSRSFLNVALRKLRSSSTLTATLDRLISSTSVILGVPNALATINAASMVSFVWGLSKPLTTMCSQGCRYTDGLIKSITEHFALRVIFLAIEPK